MGANETNIGGEDSAGAALDHETTAGGCYQAELVVVPKADKVSSDAKSKAATSRARR